MKTCLKCNESKEYSFFGRDRQKKDGLNPYCKECIKQRSQKQREEDPEYYVKYRKTHKKKLIKYNKEYSKVNRKKCNELGKKSYYKNRDEIAKRRKIKRTTDEERKRENFRQKIWRQKNPERFRKSVKKWQKKNKEKHAAHQRIHRAVEEGILIRNPNCEECGKMCKTEGHHEDYSKQLNVVWLCRLCHARKIETVEVGY